ncbi:unnamed protein product [Umbelopsis ramanniana]
MSRPSEYPQNCFLIKLRQLTILVNCPLVIGSLLPTNQHDHDQQQEAQTQIPDFAAVLSSYVERQKMLMEDSVSQLNMPIEATCVFSIPDLSLVDIHAIDCVLLTGTKHMLGLPFLTEYLGYKGRILATESSIEFASQLMEELVLYHGRTTSSASRDTLSTSMANTGSSVSDDGWRSIYTLRDARSCVNKIQAVRFRENITLFSTMRIIPYSAGHSLGSANWSLEAGYEKVAILSSTSLSTDTHPAPCDFGVLTDAKVVIFSDLVNNGNDDGTTQDEVESLSASKNKLFSYVGRAVRSRHNVVFPLCTSGIVYDLIPEIRQYLATMGIEVGSEDQSQLTMYMASPVADKSLQYSNICGEWMTDQHQDMMYVPEEPLIHGELLAKGGLQVIKSNDASMIGKQKIKEPCIIFTGDYRNLSKGPVKWFINRWKSSSLNVCIFIEPDTPPLNVLAQSMPRNSELTLLRIPIDHRLTLNQAHELLQRHCAHTTSTVHVLFPKLQGPNEWTTYGNMKWKTYESGEVITIDLQHQWERIAVTEKLAKSMAIRPFPLDEGKFYAPFSGILSLHDNRLELSPLLSVRHHELIELHKKRTLFSEPRMKQLVDRLNELGIPSSSLDIKVGETSVIVQLPSDMNARIIISHQSTRIEASDEKTRSFLRDVVLHNIVELA